MRVRQGLANHGGENQAGIRGRPGWDLGLRTALVYVLHLAGVKKTTTRQENNNELGGP